MSIAKKLVNTYSRSESIKSVNHSKVNKTVGFDILIKL